MYFNSKYSFKSLPFIILIIFVLSSFISAAKFTPFTILGDPETDWRNRGIQYESDAVEHHSGRRVKLHHNTSNRRGSFWFPDTYAVNESFEINFKYQLDSQDPGDDGGSGIAFVIQPASSQLVANEGDGQGIINTTPNYFAIIIDNHPGTDLKIYNSNQELASVSYTPIGDQNEHQVKVRFETDTTKEFKTSVWIDNLSGDPLVTATDHPAALNGLINGESAYIGFTSSTEDPARQEAFVISWSGTELENLVPSPNVPGLASPGILLGVVLLCIAVVAGGGFIYVKRKEAAGYDPWTFGAGASQKPSEATASPYNSNNSKNGGMNAAMMSPATPNGNIGMAVGGTSMVNDFASGTSAGFTQASNATRGAVGVGIGSGSVAVAAAAPNKKDIKKSDKKGSSRSKTSKSRSPSRSRKGSRSRTRSRSRDRKGSGSDATAKRHGKSNRSKKSAPSIAPVVSGTATMMFDENGINAINSGGESSGGSSRKSMGSSGGKSKGTNTAAETPLLFDSFTAKRPITGGKSMGFYKGDEATKRTSIGSTGSGGKSMGFYKDDGPKRKGTHKSKKRTSSAAKTRKESKVVEASKADELIGPSGIPKSILDGAKNYDPESPVYIGASKNKMFRTVLKDWKPATADEMPLIRGDMVQVIIQHDSGWWLGIIEGKAGVIKADCLEQKRVTLNPQIEAGPNLETATANAAALQRVQGGGVI